MTTLYGKIIPRFRTTTPIRLHRYKPRCLPRSPYHRAKLWISSASTIFSEAYSHKDVEPWRSVKRNHRAGGFSILIIR